MGKKKEAPVTNEGFLRLRLKLTLSTHAQAAPVRRTVAATTRVWNQSHEAKIDEFKKNPNEQVFFIDENHLKTAKRSASNRSKMPNKRVKPISEEPP